MKKALKTSIYIAFISVTFFSCGDVSRKVDEKIDQLQKKTESIDSLLNQEVDKVLPLDSLIDKEQQRVLKLDSLIQDSSSKIDSVADRITRPINN